MKNSVLSLIMLSTAMFAQRPFGPPPGGGFGADPARHVQMLTDHFSLTADQQKQATTIFTNAQTAASTIRDNERTARTALADAVKTNNLAAIDQLSTQLGVLSGQMLAIDSKAQAAFYATLTPDQQTKFSAQRGPRPANMRRQ